MLIFLEKYNIKKFTIAVFVKTKSKYNSVKEDFLKIKNLKEDLYKFIVKNNLKINLKIEGCMLYFAYDYLAYNDIKVSNIQKLEYGCEVGQTKLEILSNGVISGCPAHTHLDKNTNNVFKKTIKYVWNNNKDLEYYRNLKNKDPRCDNCKLNLFCNGGCPAERIKQQKTLNIENRRDDRCQF